MKIKRILTPLLIILLLFSIVVMGAPTYVNLGPTSEITGDVGVPSGSGYYINDILFSTIGLIDISTLAKTDGGIIVGDGTNFVLETGATARASLGLTIGSDVQAYDAGLLSIAGLTYASDSFIKSTAEDTYVIRTIAETKTDLSLNNVENLKVKLDATQAPTVNDDVDEGYVVGSRWCDVTNDKEYVCLDNTDGVAVWTETTATGDGAGTYLELTDTPATYDNGKYAKSTADGVVWDTPAGAGETNTASNIGAQVEIFKQKTGVDFELRTLKAKNSKTTVSNTTYESVDVGNTVIDRGTENSSRTFIEQENPANASGTIDTVEIWAVSGKSLVNCEVATFYVVSGNFLSTRDTHTIGAVTGGSKRTFSGLSLTVEAGDYIGIYFTGGAIEYENTGGTGVWQDYDNNDYIPCTNHEFSLGSGERMSLYAYGNTPTTHDYIMVGVAETEMDVMNLLSTTTVAFNADADTTLYTVPTGKRCVLSHAIVVAAGDAGATTTVSIGANGSETDFVPANTLSNLDAQYDSVILQPIPNTTPLKIKSYAAATVIEAQVASQSGAAGNTIYLFGILY